MYFYTFLIRLVSRFLYHDVARACGPMYLLYVNIRVLYIYMSRHILRSKCVTGVLFFDDDDDDVYVSYML
jgi:hypothetical protein